MEFDECASSSNLSVLVGFQFRFRPSERSVVLTPNQPPPMAMSCKPGLAGSPGAAGTPRNSEYTVGPDTGPLVQLLADGPKLNHDETSLVLVSTRFCAKV